MPAAARSYGNSSTADVKVFCPESVIAASSRYNLSYPFVVGESGHVDSGIVNRVGSMTSAEGRTLGISKAGLWDMKRRAAQGKPLKLYQKVQAKLAK